MPDTAPLFDKISKHYDLLNTIFSMGIDRRWRRELSGEVSNRSSILDIATGTAEVAITISVNNNDCYIAGIDPSFGMLEIALQKTENRQNILLVQGNSEFLPFGNCSFDAVTIAFGIRNTNDIYISLKEIYRVLKPGGKLSILEFTTPSSWYFKPLFLFYSRHIMPLAGSLFGSRDEYKYLSDSSETFPQRDSFIRILDDSGYVSTSYRELTMGIAAIYNGFKQQ